MAGDTNRRTVAKSIVKNGAANLKTPKETLSRGIRDVPKIPKVFVAALKATFGKYAGGARSRIKQGRIRRGD